MNASARVPDAARSESGSSRVSKQMSDRDRGSGVRLAVYGSLAPRRVNHHQLASLKGRWYRGTVQGRLFEEGWGSTLGFPGLILDSSGPPVEVQVFESLDLPEHWSRLDDFEGSGYRRVVTHVRTAEGELSACIYVVSEVVSELKVSEDKHGRGGESAGVASSG